MKKSNKISVFYFLTSVSLLVVLIFGGVYGVYISVGLKFVGGSAAVLPRAQNATSVAYGSGGLSGERFSVTGVIVLSIALIVIAIFDIVALIKQVIFFKQFKMVRESSIEKKIEKKVKSKGGVVAFAVVVDLLSIAAGVAGVFVNARIFYGSNYAWILYITNGAVAVLATMSLILLIVKLGKLKKQKKSDDCVLKKEKVFEVSKQCENFESEKDNNFNFNIDEIEYSLLKLKHLKSSKIISSEEYNFLRSKYFGFEKSEKVEIKKEGKED